MKVKVAELHQSNTHKKVEFNINNFNKENRIQIFAICHVATIIKKSTILVLTLNVFDTLKCNKIGFKPLLTISNIIKNYVKLIHKLDSFIPPIGICYHDNIAWN